MCCVWVNAVTITAGGQLDIRNMMIVGFSTALTQILVVLFTRRVFRWGNRMLHDAWLEDAHDRKRLLVAKLKFGACWALNIGTMLTMVWLIVACAAARARPVSPPLLRPG